MKMLGEISTMLPRPKVPVALGDGEVKVWTMEGPGEGEDGSSRNSEALVWAVRRR